MHPGKYLSGGLALLTAGLLGGVALHAERDVPYVSDLPAAEAVEIHRYLSDPVNREKSDPSSLQTRYSWQHMSEFYPTARIERSGKVRELPREIDRRIEEIAFVHDGKKETVKEHLERSSVDALLVIRHGKIVYENYRRMRPGDTHIWWSSGKVIGATMLAILEEEGKIDTSRPVSAYLPELRGSVWDEVRVREALDMATGLDGTEHDEPGHDSRTNPRQIWHRWAVSIGMYPDTTNAEASPMEIIRSMKRRHPPYTRFEYNSINTFVINRIVEAVSGMPLHRYFTKRVWSKIGARNDGYVVVTPREGYGLFYGMMNSTLEDMGKFGMIFTPGAAGILPPKAVERMQIQTEKGMYDRAFMGRLMTKKFGEKGMANRYQWDAVFEDGDLYKSGFGGQGLYVSPARDMVVVWFGTGDGSTYEEPMARAIVKFYDSGRTPAPTPGK